MTDIACVTINYKNPEDTIQCIESIVVSGSSSFKIFLINNYSEDGSGDVLKKYLLKSGIRFSYLEPPENLGFTGGVNLGIENAITENFEHILLLNNDTVVAENFTGEVINAFEKYPGEVIAGQVLDYSTGRPSYNVGHIYPLTGHVHETFATDYKNGIDFVSGCLMLIPISAIKTVGSFDNRYFMYREDFDFCIRLKKAGIKIRFCPDISIRHKVSSSSKRSKTPVEYYRIRNQTHIVFRQAKPLQKVFYTFFLGAMLLYKIFRRPTLFAQAFLGIKDALIGRLGKQH